MRCRFKRNRPCTDRVGHQPGAYAKIDVLQFAERLILGALMGLALFGMMTLSMAVPCLYTVCAASYRRIICCIGLYLNKTARFTALVCR